jgi:uncharacterized protein YegJ (DUF2314 family)
MTKRLALALVALLAIVPALPMVAAAQSNMMIVPNGDPEMAAAIAKARGALPSFWKALEHPGAGEEGFALKVAIKDGKDVEHFWLLDIARDGDKLSGTINNEPEIVGNVSNGERYEFTDADISDWLYMRKGKMVGNETMRPLLKRMPKSQAEQYRAMYETP